MAVVEDRGLLVGSAQRLCLIGVDLIKDVIRRPELDYARAAELHRKVVDVCWKIGVIRVRCSFAFRTSWFVLGRSDLRMKTSTTLSPLLFIGELLKGTRRQRGDEKGPVA